MEKGGKQQKMEKTRLTAIDILCLITSFNINPSPSQPHYRLANIYSTNPTAASSAASSSTSVHNKHYLLKLGHSQKKLTIAIESGHRIHETLYKRDKEKTPNQLCLKLRKYIKGRRLDAVKQIGLDRVIYFDFGGYFLVMEFYAKGNIILTDENWKILCLLRRHEKGEEDVKYAVGETYPVELRKQYNPITRERIADSLNENKLNGSLTLIKFLNQCLDYGPDIILHCLTKSEIDPNLKISEFINADEKIDSLFDSLREADRIVSVLMNNVEQEGFIFLHPSSDSSNDNGKDLTPPGISDSETLSIPEELRERYFTCHPILFEQYKSYPYIKFSSYNHAVDEYFSALDQQRVSNQKKNIEKLVNKKLDKIKKEQDDRVKNLDSDSTRNHRHADLITENLDLVNAAIGVIRTAIEQSMDWEEIKDIVEQQKELGDPVAKIIRKFDLEKNMIGLLLESHNAEESSHPEIVMVDVTKSAFANVKDYYSKKKKASYKKEMTLAVQKKTLQLAEEKSKEKLLIAQSTKLDVTKMRKVYWFEKFNWFITSENFLVISGRDAQQNELLVRRYLKKGDIYVHADIHGAASCIVKNPTPEVPIPLLSLNEACNYCVCRSKAWDSKLGGLSAWWVYDDQVSKTAPSGEYLSTGSFMIRGKKNYVPHCPLTMGFGILFRVTEEDVIARHSTERRIRGGEDVFSDPGSDLTAPDSQFEREFAQHEANQEKQADSNPSSDNNNEDEENEQESDSEEPDSPDSPEEEKDDANSQEAFEDNNEENINDDDRDSSEENNGEVINQDATLSEIEKLIQEYKNMDDNQKKRTFNMKDKKYYKQLKKKGESETSAIEKTIEKKIAKLQEATSKPESDDELDTKKKPKKQQVKKAHTKKQKKIAAKLDEMDEEEKELTRQRLGIKRQTPEELKSEKQRLIEEKMQEEKRRKREEKRLKQFFEEENIPFMTEEDRKKIHEIDTLTSVPHDDDTILFAIPICAPYYTLRQYKYRFKLTPGSGKRGKIAKNIHQILQKASGYIKNPTEVEALKRLTHDEMILTLIGNSQLSLPRELTKKKKK